MPLNGQASGAWTESSSALRLLHIAVRNAIGILTDDAFTQTNPTAVTVAATISTRIDQTQRGVLSGSVAFTRPDAGSNFHGGPGTNAQQTAFAAAAAQAIGYKPLGVYVNSATGNSYENLPGQASGKNTYMSGQGTYSNGAYETALIANSADAVNNAQSRAITYITGMFLMASRNGLFMPTEGIGIDGARDNFDVIAMSAESFVQNAYSQATVLGVVKMPPDAAQTEIVYDQRL